MLKIDEAGGSTTASEPDRAKGWLAFIENDIVFDYANRMF